MRCYLPLSVLAFAWSCQAFAPVTMPAGLRTRAANTAVSGRAGARLGLRSLRAVATNADHAPTAMDWEKLPERPWGSVETDFMTVCKYGPETGGKWTKCETLPYGDLSITPRAAVLNYGQGLFEGMKAQRTEDGRIVIFRPEMNARRTQYGCERLLMPPVPTDVFVDAVKQCVLANAKWVPPKGQGTLYIRPIIIGTGPILGLAPAPSYTFCIYVSPVGSYFKGSQLTPIKIKVEDSFTRAAPGGSGGVKAIGNYAPSLMPQKKSKEAGFDNCLYLDAAERKYLEEIGTSNIFLVKDKTIMTPALKGGGAPEDTILEGITRASIMQVCKDKGYEVVEKRVSVEEALECDEALTVGTAVVVSPIGEMHYKGQVKKWDVGPITQEIYDTLTGIQTGTHEDKHGWTVYLN